jgi:hypothetical protein
MAERLAVGSLPDYLVVSYDVLSATVVLAEFIDGYSIDALRVHARTAPGPTAANRMDRRLDQSCRTRAASRRRRVGQARTAGPRGSGAKPAFFKAEPKTLTGLPMSVAYFWQTLPRALNLVDEDAMQRDTILALHGTCPIAAN